MLAVAATLALLGPAGPGKGESVPAAASDPAAALDAAAAGDTTATSDETSNWHAPSLADNTAGVIRVRTSIGGSCSGIPLRNTPYVVTAAHCLIGDRVAIPRQKIDIIVDGKVSDNAIRWMTFHHGYFTDEWVAYDVAILTATEMWSFGADSIGESGDAVDILHAYGFQPVDSSGVRLSPDDLSAGSAQVSKSLVRCTVRRVGISYEHGSLRSLCGLVPGASGGPLLAQLADGRHQIVGVVSTITVDWKVNRFATAEALTDLVNGNGFSVEADPAADGWMNGARPPMHAAAA